MRCMLRNKVSFFYALFEAQEEIKDEYGNSTGQYAVRYGVPVILFGNVSSAQGEAQTSQFGENVRYDKVIVIDDVNIPIDEVSVLWVDTVPELTKEGHLVTTIDGEIKTPHDYIVRKVARSLNSVSIAISKVNVSG